MSTSRSDKGTTAPYDSMIKWVERDGNEYALEGAAEVAARLEMADLFLAHSEATRKLCGRLKYVEEERWEEVLVAVCKEIGRRFIEGAAARRGTPERAL